jgi:hypothetical protein
VKNIFFLSIIFFIAPDAVAKAGPSAITWRANGGRFGDNLLSYCKAKWISYQFNLPLLYQNFKYSNELILSKNEEMFTQKHLSKFSHITQLFKLSPHTIIKDNSTLYISQWKINAIINWADPIFLAEIKKNIAPINPLEKIIIPDGVISIAAHVRDGGTFHVDTPEEKERCPLRFVPAEFFIAQIDRIAQLFPHDILYVHIFTDHPNPQKLAHKFQSSLNNPRITFGFREVGNSHKSNVLEDFFSMMDFDCLIRPGSQFTRFVQRLGNNTLVIYPETFKEINGKKVIDTIKLKRRKTTSDPWKTQTIVIV